MTTLEFGAKGEEVKALQKILKDQGVFKGAVRGNFLNLTKAAVVAFQQTHSGPKDSPLRTDGVVDEDTCWALQNPSDSLAKEPTLRHGSKGESVKIVQQLLKEQGFFKGAVRGNFLKLTDEAVRYFQNTHLGPNGEFLESDGIVGTDTWWALHNPVGKPQKSNLPGEIPDGLTPMRQRVLQIALAEHAAGVREKPNGDNKGDGVTKYLPGGRPAAWCCYFWSWVNREAFGKFSLGARHGRVSTAFARARKFKMARAKGDYIPIPGDAFVMTRTDAETGKFKFTGLGHIGYVLRVEVSRGKAVAFNTVEGNTANRVKVGKRKISDPEIIGFINNYDKDEQPSDWEKGLVKAVATGGSTTR